MSSRQRFTLLIATTVLAVLAGLSVNVGKASGVPERDERLRCACLEGLIGCKANCAPVMTPSGDAN
jgi:hypothetical protein